MTSPPGRPAPVTIRDVARAAGVSVTTVSHALNGKGRVDPTTRADVERAADALGYRANRTARGLRSGRTGTIGLLLPELDGGRVGDELIGVDFYLQVAAAATRAAFARDHALLLLPPVRNAGELRRVALDGAILNDPTAGDPRIDAFDRAGLPLVTIDRDLARPERPWWVASDNTANTRAVLDHLAAAGARRIALLTAANDWSWLAESRAAYAAWCRERRREPLVAATALDLAATEAHEAAGTLLDGPDPPDAIFTPPERFALGASRAARRRGLRIGSDLLLATGVDSHEVRAHDPPITALDLDPGAQSRAAVDMLLALIAGDEPDAPRLVPAELRVRASTLG